MQNVIVLAIIVVAIIVASLAGRSAWKRSAARAGGRGRAKPVPVGELVAVIAAAVAAASGMEIGSFRVVGVEPTSEGAAFARRGLNTPAWGHVERFIRLGE